MQQHQQNHNHHQKQTRAWKLLTPLQNLSNNKILQVVVSPLGSVKRCVTASSTSLLMNSSIVLYCHALSLTLWLSV